jgi:hypothetical protein
MNLLFGFVGDWEKYGELHQGSGAWNCIGRYAWWAELETDWKRRGGTMGSSLNSFFTGHVEARCCVPSTGERTPT